jgi:hypothetical protein
MNGLLQHAAALRPYVILPPAPPAMTRPMPLSGPPAGPPGGWSAPGAPRPPGS